MGMTPQQFWDMPPVLFFRKVDGYFQRENRHGVYFRESFALHYNINRGEKNPAIEGTEVIRLPGEEPKREPRQRAAFSKMTLEDLASVTCRMNDQGWPPPWKPADRKFTDEELEGICNGSWTKFPFYLEWKAAQQLEQPAQEPEQPAQDPLLNPPLIRDQINTNP